MKIYLSSKADKQLNRLPSQMHKVLIGKIEKLREEPYPAGIKKLKARPAYRMRVGDYRILYALDSVRHEITILSVAHRKEVYRY